MKNMDKGADKLAQNTPIIPKSVSAQIVCLSPKVWDFDEKKASLDVCSPWSVASQKCLRAI